MSHAADMTEPKETPADNAAPEAVVPANGMKDDGPTWVPQFAKNAWQGVHKQAEKARTAAIMLTPAYGVNNSSNFLAAMHIGTEMMMFKSGMGENHMVKDWSNPINWVWQPAQAIWKDIYTKNQSKDYTIGMLLDGNPIKNVQEWLNPHDATLRAIGREAEAVQPKQLKIGSPWQTRTTLTGLIIWTISAFIPERKESDEQIEKMAKMRTLHPLQYIGTRLKQALWFPEWQYHKREMLGLGYLGIGTLSGIGSWFNRAAMVDIPKEYKDNIPYIKNALETHVREVKAALGRGEKVTKQVVKDVELIEKALEKGHLMQQRYSFNAGYLFTSIVSFAQGFPLLFALDERKGYSTYGAMAIFRTPALVKSIGEKMGKKEAGWQYYAGSKISFQVEDLLFMLIGGATKKKRPDGTYEIIDHEALKKKAVYEAKEEKLKTQEFKVEKELMQDKKLLHQVAGTAADGPALPAPDTKMVKVVEHERAMPQHVEAHGQKQVAGVM